MNQDIESAEFDALAREFADWVLSSFPTFATFAGVHRYDDRLQDMSAAGFEETVRRARGFGERAETLRPASIGQEIDLALIRSTAWSTINTHETLREWTRQPSLYLREALFGTYLLLLRDFAPLEERAANLARRLRLIPTLMEQARANLDRPPRTWTDTAIREAEGGIRFFTEQAASLDTSAVGERLAGEVSQAALQAVKAIKTFRDFLEDDLLPRSDGEFAVGEQTWNAIVRESQMLDADAAEILERGKQLVESTRAELKAVCASVDAGTGWKELLRRYRNDHPSPDQLMEVYIEAVGASRDFVMESGFAGIPEGERLEVRETPGFQRPVIPYAAYVSPGAFEKQQEGIFWVTPVDDDMSADHKQAKLRSHANGKIPVVALHEGYPGHHLQLTWSNKVSSLVQDVANTSTLFVEGWAFYCEEIMDRQGFLNDPASKVFRLADQLWRAYRIVIDVGLHCDGLAAEEAVRMLVEEAGLEEPDAQAEVRRYTQSPTQPMSYLIGKEEILKVLEEYRRHRPGQSLRQTHDAVLGCGSLAPTLLRRKLLGASETRV